MRIEHDDHILLKASVIILHERTDMIDLNELANGLPAISKAFGQYLAEAGAVCLESQGHSEGQKLFVRGLFSNGFPLYWPIVTEQMARCLNDPDESTEYGAVGIAILLIKRLVGFAVIQRSRKGTGFDYWLGDEGDTLFQNKARLEVSGIRKGSNRIVNARVYDKLSQTKVSDDSNLPAYIVVVEFGEPLAEMRKR